MIIEHSSNGNLHFIKCTIVMITYLCDHHPRLDIYIFSSSPYLHIIFVEFVISLRIIMIISVMIFCKGKNIALWLSCEKLLWKIFWNVVCNFQWKAVIALKDQKENPTAIGIYIYIYIAAILLWNITSMFNQKENISATLLMRAIERSSVAVGIIVLIVSVFHTAQPFLCFLFWFCVFLFNE